MRPPNFPGIHGPYPGLLKSKSGNIQTQRKGQILNKTGLRFPKPYKGSGCPIPTKVNGNEASKPIASFENLTINVLVMTTALSLIGSIDH